MLSENIKVGTEKIQFKEINAHSVWSQNWVQCQPKKQGKSKITKIEIEKLVDISFWIFAI